jgi:polysaccharide biosynthesis transport protein
MKKTTPSENLPMDPATMGAGNEQYLPSTEFRESVPEWEGEEVHFRDYLDVVMRRKWLIFGVLGLVFISTLIFTLTTPKLYRASTTIEVGRESANVTKFEQVAAAEAGVREFYETQVSLLRSHALLERVFDKMGLIDHPVIKDVLFGKQNSGILSRLKELLRSFLAPGQEEAAEPVISEEILNRQKLVDFFDNNLSVAMKRNSTLINVSFVSSDRHLSQNLVNTMGDEFIRWKMDQKLEASQLAREFLTKQIDRSKINMEKAEEEMNRFAKQAGIVSLDPELNSVFSELKELNDALGKSEADMISKKASYDQATEDGPSSLPQVLNSSVIIHLTSEHAKLHSQYEELTTTFLDEYPEVKVLKSRMRSIEERIQAEEQRVYKSIKHEYQSAVERVTAFQNRVNVQKERALNLNERATQYKIMAREVETNKGIYQSLLERAKEIESMVGVSTSSINIIDRARLPIFPFKPNVKMNLLLAIMVGLMAGIGLAFVLEYFADTITNPEQISDRFQIPILGVVPVAKKADYPLDKAFVSDPKCPLAESIRTTKVSIQLSGANEVARSFLVTSTSPSEGKTTMALNLAMAFSSSDERVVLIDSDLRKPRVHKVFGFSGNGSTPGLSSYLAGVVEEGIIMDTDIENLSVIPAGPIPPNPVELLASKRFTQLISDLSESYDRIIVDGPPHHGFADVLVLSRQLGGVVLVSSIGETTRDALRHFKKGIMNVRGNILGCIINKVNISKRYGYSSYYRYYGAYNYEYGENKGKKKNKLLGRA